MVRQIQGKASKLTPEGGGVDIHKTQTWMESEREFAPIVVPSVRAEAPRRPKLEPTEAMRRAKAWVEAISHPPVPEKSMLAMHGWLSPEGDLYACGWQKHDELARALGFLHQSEIEGAGYCKLSSMEWLVAPRYRARELTEQQWETISEWYEKNGFPEEHYLRLTTTI